MSDPYDIDDAPKTPPHSPPPPAVPAQGDVPARSDEPLPVPSTNYAATAATLLKISAAVALFGTLTYLIQAVVGGGVIAGALGCVFALASLIFIAAIILYMLWQHGAYKLVRSLGNETTYTPGWSVGWWFVPVANLIFTKPILQDLWRASGATAGASSAGDLEAKAGSRPQLVYLLLVGWAAASILGAIFMFISARLGFVVYALAYVVVAAFFYTLSQYTDDVERAIDAKMPVPKKGPRAVAPAA